MKRSRHTFYSKDPREIPNYRISEVAHYLGLPTATLTYWCRGGKRHGRRMRPVIRMADQEGGLLSFLNLVEAHVLASLRRVHEMPLQKVRRTLTYVEKRLSGIPHPLSSKKFRTDGVDAFVQYQERLLNVSREGQQAMREILLAHLLRIDFDKAGRAMRLYPFEREVHFTESAKSQPRNILIDPRISFGRPVIAGTGIAAEVVAERFRGGDNPKHLANDYGISSEKVFTAIRYESQKAA